MDTHGEVGFELVYDRVIAQFVLTPDSPVRWSLRNQLLWPFAGVMAVTLVLVSSVNGWLAARRATEQIQSQLSKIAETLKRPPFPLTESVLRQARSLSGAELVVTDSEGK